MNAEALSLGKDRKQGQYVAAAAGFRAGFARGKRILLLGRSEIGAASGSYTLCKSIAYWICAGQMPKNVDHQESLGCRLDFE